ncbi:bifunctional folylpolyglutamate synthase/dihydrofolate synthase [Pseudogracilibacillus auburnensis]|uniref:bifunctional folylpolyglutamate synthase/dihydrofolate synthase n=1 Tax=Pseudogracilibacillus auburnensis TaxID=1494959 RepID=UPI001A9682F4|nr:Mur ligase family protein [Pseudogracilibacillus auburnensis]MBO1004849.1 hypothetical protein [Pseudogracilibacillus auburnensis]
MKDAENLVYRSYLRAIKNIEIAEDAKVKKPELTRQLFDRLGSPDIGQKFILVTGSKGKGSTSRFISSLLGHLGYKVGLFTSPHLVDFNERIRIGGKAISDEDFMSLSEQVLPSFEEIEDTLAEDEYQGPIGIALAIATLYFRENNTDINVIECGRGGSFDDANILENEWAVITPVMEEHLNFLGPTIGDVIDHKLGIIKPSTKLVYISEQQEQISQIIEKKLSNYSGEIAYYGTDFEAKNIQLNARGTGFDVATSNQAYAELTLPLLGKFQASNAAIAVKICEDIYGRVIDLAVLKNCFGTMQWPGRCEIIDENPTVIVDGAIHEESAKHVGQVLQKISGYHIITIISVPSDKDYKGVIKVASEFSYKIIITKPDISHLNFPDDAYSYARSLLSNSIETSELKEAVQLAKIEEAVDIILILGTQTLIANAKRLWNQDLLDIGI